MRYLCILFLASLLMQAPSQVNAQNVYDYYQSLPESCFYIQDLGNIKYPLSKKADTWFSKSIADYDIAPTVDIKNGYIEISDEGTGWGSIFQQIVLFRKADRSPLIGITIGGFNGFYFDSNTTFYKKSGDKWIEAANVFPELNIQRFLTAEYRSSQYTADHVITPNLTSLTFLPQYGTTVMVELNFSKFDFLIEANQNVYKQQSFSEEEAKKLSEIIDNISIESFQLKFDKEMGGFVVQDSTQLNGNESNSPGEEEGAIEYISDEQYVLDMLWQLDMVGDLAVYIDSVSDHTRDFKLIFEGIDAQKPDFFRVRGIEDNGGNYVTHLVFLVKKDASEVYLYDALEDDFVKIEQ